MASKRKPRTETKREPPGEAIRRLREERGLSVAEAAEQADFSPVLWLKVEAEAGDDVPLSTLRVIADGLDMKLHELVAELE